MGRICQNSEIKYGVGESTTAGKHMDGVHLQNCIFNGTASGGLNSLDVYREVLQPGGQLARE